MTYLPEPPFQHGSPSRIGVLLVNLGTPQAPTPSALRRYLKEFLWDPRVVELPRPLWWLILNGFILNTRPKESARRYAQVWTPDGSPLRVYTERQAKLLQGYLGERVKPAPRVEFAMRYGNPSVASALARLKELGCDRVLVLPLYPQYSASTTASAFDAVFKALQRMHNTPALRLVKHFHDHPRYIAALEKRVREHWEKHGQGELLLMSFHGVPRYTLERGDPYHCECQKTARLLAEALALNADQYRVAFQSRFGRAQWLKPYTAEVLTELGRRGTRRVDVICPGFVSDCLETLEEIAIEGKGLFLGAGGKEFHYVPALNDRPDWIHALAALVLEHLQGWLDGEPGAEALQRSRERALALGAKS
ncbi:ferrochelatase [Pelomicrobium methylotrophicum]|uniref:Ferrochelatase n=1 Tax=Pelomicrobium methylotrophicum TaxID=2602750 RepID=A0A5C7EW72_9PROT|nr:ferrochelatase [Pelomicrobium methylotrophicum]TXF11330.1 ferrochelatase [Pelomicrobium methylotrophicum]